MTARLPDAYFDRMYADADDPWELSSRWYEQRKYAITMALLPNRRYRHAFEPGCSIGTLTELLTQRCDHVTADRCGRSGAAAPPIAGCRQPAAGHQVTLARSSLDEPWPAGDVRPGGAQSRWPTTSTPTRWPPCCAARCPGWRPARPSWQRTGATTVADYPLTGDIANEVIAATPGLTPLGRYRDDDVVIEVFDTGSGLSVAAREGVPGSSDAASGPCGLLGNISRRVVAGLSPASPVSSPAHADDGTTSA